MTSPNAVFTELVTTTFRNHKKTLADNVSNNNAFLSRLNKNGNTRIEDGGLTITMPLEYATNGTYQRYSGFDVLNVASSDVFTAAEFPWTQIAVNVVASGRELRINSGSEQIINLAKARLKNAMHTFANLFSADVYSDGTATNQVNGLQALIADSGQGTVGGIDAATWTFWRNQVQSAAAPIGGGGAVTLSPTTIEGLMLGLWLQLVRGNDKPDIIVASNDYFAMYEQSQVSIKRYTSDTDVSGGFTSLKYKGCDVIFDGNSGIPNSRMYFINSNYCELVAHKDANMTVNDEVRPYNQDATVIPILWMGNLDVSNRRLQGVLKP